jgi:Mg-chelatase subunit ChlD
MLRVSAPAMPQPLAQTVQARRTPVALAIVVDESGSMHERLDAVRAFVLAVLEHLRPDDVVALVGFDDRVRVHAPAQPLQGGLRIRQVLSALRSGGGTDLLAGWQAGAACVAPFQATHVARVVLLSDGEPTVGADEDDPPAQRERHRAAVAQGWAQGIRTSTVGLGPAFPESLLLSMAQAGHGQCHFVPDSESLSQALVQLLHDIDAVALDAGRLRLWAANGVRVTMRGQVPDASGEWTLPPLVAGSAVTWLADLEIASWGADDRDHPFLANQAWLEARLEGRDAFRRGFARSATLRLGLGAPPREADPVVEAAIADAALADALGSLYTGPVHARRLDARRLRRLIDALPSQSMHRGWLTALSDRASREADEAAMSLLWKETVFAGEALRAGQLSGTSAPARPAPGEASR